jgi:hypothetical protein
MNASIRRATLALAMLAMTAGPAFADQATAKPESDTKASFIAADFKVPTLVQTPGFKLVPLGPALVKVDFDAYMSSIEHLQKTFTRSTSWPHKDISDADAMKDMETEQARFEKRESFAYRAHTRRLPRARLRLCLSQHRRWIRRCGPAMGHQGRI